MLGGIPAVWKNLRYKIISNMLQCYLPICNDYHQLIVHYTENHFLLAFLYFFLQDFNVSETVFKMPSTSSVSFKSKGSSDQYKTYSLGCNVAVSSDWIQKQCSSPDHKPIEFHVWSLVKNNTFAYQD